MNWVRRSAFTRRHETRNATQCGTADCTSIPVCQSSSWSACLIDPRSSSAGTGNAKHAYTWLFKALMMSSGVSCAAMAMTRTPGCSRRASLAMFITRLAEADGLMRTTSTARRVR